MHLLQYPEYFFVFYIYYNHYTYHICSQIHIFVIERKKIKLNKNLQIEKFNHPCTVFKIELTSQLLWDSSRGDYTMKYISLVFRIAQSSRLVSSLNISLMLRIDS